MNTLIGKSAGTHPAPQTLPYVVATQRNATQRNATATADESKATKLISALFAAMMCLTTAVAQPPPPKVPVPQSYLPISESFEGATYALRGMQAKDVVDLGAEAKDGTKALMVTGSDKNGPHILIRNNSNEPKKYSVSAWVKGAQGSAGKEVEFRSGNRYADSELYTDYDKIYTENTFDSDATAILSETDWVQVKAGIVLVPADKIVELTLTNKAESGATAYPDYYVDLFEAKEAIATEINLDNYTTVSEIQTAIQTELNTWDVATVTVTGEFAGANSSLNLTIPANKKVIWSAEYSGNYGNDLIRLSGEGEFIIDANGSLTNSGWVISIVGNVTFTLDGGLVESKDGSEYPMYASNNATVIINGGAVTNNASLLTIGLDYNAALAIHGGTINNQGGAVVEAFENNVVYVTDGSGIDDGSIIKYGNAIGYYIGASNEDKFGYGFTEGTNLFRLDVAPELTEENGDPHDPSTAYVGKLTATFLAGLNITNATADEINVYDFDNNTVTLTGTFDGNITLEIEGTLAGSRIPVSFTTAAFGVNVAKIPTDISIEISPEEITYGTTYTVSATTSAGNVGTFDFWYNGTTAGGNAYSSADKPTQVGTYTVTATLVSNTHIAAPAQAQFTIAEDNTPIRLSQAAIGNIRIYANSNGIILENVPPNAKVEVYNLQGKLIHRENPKIGGIGVLTIKVQTKGIYIVKANGKTVKVVK